MRVINIENKKDPTLSICIDTIKLKKQALVFCSSKKSAESVAEKLAKLNKDEINVELDELSEKIETILANPTKQCLRLSKCIKKGIAFHHAGLSSKQREMIEDVFRDGLIHVICSTPTLAAGLDLPAFRTIIRSLKRFSEMRSVSIPVLEYLQMAGRAGRPGKEEYGEAIIVSKSESELKFLFENYVNGEVEAIYSKLAVEPVLRMYILSLIASEKLRNKKNLLNFFDNTFYAFQFGDKETFHRKIENTIIKLEYWKMLEIKNKNMQKETAKSLFTSGLNLLNNKKEEYSKEEYKPTLLGKRVSEIYIDPLTAHLLIKNLNKFHKETSINNEIDYIKLLHIVTCSLEMRPLLRTGAKDYDTIEKKSLEFKDQLLVSDEDFYKVSTSDYEDTLKTTLFLLDWSNEKTEDKLLEEYNIRPGEIAAKLNISDWLIYACEELSRIEGQLYLQTFLKKSRKRLKEGVKTELLTLLRFKGVGRIRARKLFNANIKNVTDIKNIDINSLIKLIGLKLAISLKDQVGIKINEDEITETQKEVKSKKRKQSQSSLNNFL